MKKFFINALMLTLLLTAVSAYADTEPATIMDKLAQDGIITEYYTQDFEEWEGSDGVIAPPAGFFEIVDNMGRGKSFKLFNTEGTEPEMSGIFGGQLTAEAVIYKQSVCFSETSKTKPFAIFRSSASSNNEMLTLRAQSNGEFQLLPAGTSLVGYEANTWYDIVYVLNFVTKTYDVYINNELCADDIEFPNKSFDNFKRIYFMKLWSKNIVGEAYIDDIGLYSYIPYPSATLDKTEIAYDADEINVNFSTAMKKESFENAVTVKDLEGNLVKTDGVLSEDKTKYIISFKEVLKHGMTYTVTLGDSIVSTADMNNTTPELEFTTEPELVDEILFRCGSGYITDMSETAGKTVQTLCFVNDPEKEVMLITALYSNNRMVSVKSSSNLIKIGEQGRVNVPLSVPNDGNEYVIKAYLWDNAENQAAYMVTAELR